jgi:Tfp pilus assembly protein PilN
MRAINLIPPEERRGDQAPLRSGPLAYILIGALVVVLIGVTALVLVGNQINDRKSEVAKLKVEDAAAKARAERLAAFTQFRLVREQRVATVTSLADSRFDWERVMRELSLVLPRNVWLVGLSASASAEATIGEGGGGGGGGGGLRSSVPGPAMELSGCTTGQEAVAGFVTALKDIDGVTRVAVDSSELADEESGAGVVGGGGGGGGSESNSTDCRTRNFIAKFEIVVAFDAAPVPLAATGGEEAPASATEQAETASTDTSKGSEKAE